MTDWSALNIIKDTLITFYFGSPVAFYSSIVVLFLLALIIAGLDLRMALVFSLPLIAAFSIFGIFGIYTWVFNLMLLIIGIIYAFILIQMFT